MCGGTDIRASGPGLPPRLTLRVGSLVEGTIVRSALRAGTTI